jgi:hypothetical protein
MVLQRVHMYYIWLAVQPVLARHRWPAVFRHVTPRNLTIDQLPWSLGIDFPGRVSPSTIIIIFQLDTC